MTTTSQPVSIALIQCTTPPDPAAALEHLSTLFKSVDPTADLVCMPETVNSVGAKDPFAVAARQDDDPMLSWLCQEARTRQQAMIVGSLALIADDNPKKLVNRSFYIDEQGDIVATYDKIHMFDAHVGEKPADHYKESRRFMPGTNAMVVRTPCMTVGMSICYDLRQPSLYRKLARSGATVLSVPAAFTIPTGRKHWRILLQARAIENGAFVIAPAQCGAHTEQRHTWGHSMVVDPDGAILLDAGDEPGVHHVTLDVSEAFRARHAIPALNNEQVFVMQDVAVQIPEGPLVGPDVNSD